LEALGFGTCPVCIAKTQYSFSDDPALIGAPEGFTVTVKNVKISAGAGFVVVLTGDILTMPGLPKVPSAEKIDELVAMIDAIREEYIELWNFRNYEKGIEKFLLHIDNRRAELLALK
jgi:hypothetical protein